MRTLFQYAALLHAPKDAWALTVLLLADPTVARALLDALRRWPASRTTRHLIRSISDSQREDDL